MTNQNKEKETPQIKKIKEEGWRDKLLEIWSKGTTWRIVENFIESSLLSQKKEIKEMVEGMIPIDKPEMWSNDESFNEGYRSGLKDVLEKL